VQHAQGLRGRNKQVKVGGATPASLTPVAFANLQRHAQDFHWIPRPKDRTWVLGEGAATLSHQLGGLASAVSSPSGIRGTQGGLSWHYNVVNCGRSCSHWGKIPVSPAYAPPNLNPGLVVEFRFCLTFLESWILIASGITTKIECPPASETYHRSYNFTRILRQLLSKKFIQLSLSCNGNNSFRS